MQEPLTKNTENGTEQEANDDTNGHVDSDDEVVGEIDVFLSRPPENHEIHVLQYPLRHAQVGIGSDRRVTGVNIRPQHGRVEVQVSVFPDDPATAGDDFGCAQPSSRSFDGAQAGAEEKNIGQIQRLRSRAHLEAPRCNYAVASLVPSNSNAEELEFVIAPVHAVSQLRPAFDYLDKYDVSVLRQRVEDKLYRMNARGEISSQNGMDGTGAGSSEEIAPLEMNFRKRESERAAEKRRNSHATLREREEGEAWIQLEYNPSSSEASKKRINELFTLLPTSSVSLLDDTKGKKKSNNKEDDGLADNTGYKELFHDHTKGSRMDNVAKSTLNPEEASSRTLKIIATNAAVIQVIAYARIVPFSEIRRLVGHHRPLKEVLTATRVAGYCLRGNWVAKKGTKELRKLTSVAERYDSCRILILALFRRHRIVKTKMAEEELGTPLVITEATVRKVLKEVAEEERGIGWELRVNDDEEFKTKYANIFRAQETEWDNRVAKARETVSKIQRQIKRRTSLK